MGGFIILDDGRAWAATNWAYDAAIRYIAEALPDSERARELSEWLLQQTSEVQGMGLGSIDIRELTAENRTLFVEAIRRATRRIEERGAEGWNDPSYFPVWKERFEVLLKLIESVEKGEPATIYNPHMRDIIPATGKQAGPGWDDPEAA